MVTETKSNLNEETIEKLQELIRANVDASKVFREAAEEIEDIQIANLLSQQANDCSAMAAELKGFVEGNGANGSHSDGTYYGDLHAAWINLRGKLNSGDPYVILIEAERGEDHIKHAYEDVLKETAGSPVNDVLMAQYRKVKQGHDRVRDLRDLFKKK